MENPSIQTLAVHAGRPLAAPGGAPSEPAITQAVSYRAPDAAALHALLDGSAPGFAYSRYGSPTNEAFEQALCALEGAATARAFASGMAAIQAALLLADVRAGERVLAAQDCYGATFAMLDTLLRKLGVETHFVDAGNLPAVEAALAELRPRALLVEPISNPLLKLADIAALAELSRAYQAHLIVDSTFATPCLLRPLELGAQIVVHSVTKYLSGHDDVLGGVVLAGEGYAAALRELAIITGGVLGPQEAYLALRGLRTLPLRMREHCANALRVAAWLAEQPSVVRVHYPGLESHPQHALACRLLRGGFGGIVAFSLRGGEAEVLRFMDALQLVMPVTTLGGVASQLLYPARSSHRALPPETRRALGIDDGLLRLSVGIEAADDILADLAGALAAL
jgi:cystathionine beta-lyase/cystathionine gamma-synthase